MSEKLETPANIAFTISFDKDTVTIDAKNLSGQGVSIAKNTDESNIIITIVPKKDIEKSQSIISLPFTGDITDILLSEAVATLNNGKEKNLSIGSLNQTSPHTSK